MAQGMHATTRIGRMPPYQLINRYAKAAHQRHVARRDTSAAKSHRLLAMTIIGAREIFQQMTHAADIMMRAASPMPAKHK